ncbi:hypothetical protein DIPPA_02966 [Diplonema papillatum]|nr:hypothetical protein DIPPA_02966 [Diplonema papillatum]
MFRRERWKKKLENFTDEFCNVFTGDESDEAEAAKVEEGRRAVKDAVLSSADDTFAASHQFAASQLMGCSKHQCSSLVNRIASSTGRRAFRAHLEHEEDGALPRISDHHGMTIRPIDTTSRKVNVGLSLDGNSDTAHVRHFSLRRPAPTVCPAACPDYAFCAARSFTDPLQYAAATRKHRAKPAPLRPSFPRFTPSLRCGQLRRRSDDITNMRRSSRARRRVALWSK